MYTTRIALGTDHAGYLLKEAVKAHLIGKGLDIIDEGTFSGEPVDYPAIIRRACAHTIEQGIPAIVFGGSGQGEAIAANKVPGIRAARCLTLEDARLARSHNDANVLSLAGRMTTSELALQMVDVFLETPFEGGRHIARVKDIEEGARVPFFDE
ncbi:MAG: sugar-phosphate isomerase, RpiB/LacA/LacB family [Candidatus Peribacteria bacterium]|nr:sugar-phosphate isomerase, RpiB/LacA/LacB family [Candidatus Peribacteria bacterium]